MSTYNSGELAISGNASGTEKVTVDNGGAVIVTLTTAQIGATALSGGVNGNFSLAANGNITVTNGIITAINP